MSIPTKEQATRFLAPLRGGVATLLLHEIQAKLTLSRLVLGCAGALSLDTTILDSDAYYSTNMQGLAEEAGLFLKGEVLLLPERDFEVASLLPLISSRRELVIIDDLNSLYSLASDGRKSQQLGIILKLLSYGARLNRSWVVAIVYRTEMGQKRGGANHRSLTAMGDQLIDTDLRGGSIRLRAGSKNCWTDGEYTA